MPNTFKFRGLADYAFVQNTNLFGKYSINLYADKNTRKEIKATGLRGSDKEGKDELLDGMYFVFRRDVSRVWKGVTTLLDKPYVTMEDGTDVTEIIGTGSDVTVEVEVYDFKAGTDPQGNAYPAGKGSRLVGVVVHNLVPYVSPNTEEHNEVAAPVAAPPTKRAKAAGDGIPF
jgi:hypothetical protein